MRIVCREEWIGVHMTGMVKDVNGQILRDGVDVRRRWAEYFQQVMKMSGKRIGQLSLVFCLTALGFQILSPF